LFCFVNYNEFLSSYFSFKDDRLLVSVIRFLQAYFSVYISIKKKVYRLCNSVFAILFFSVCNPVRKIKYPNFWESPSMPPDSSLLPPLISDVVRTGLKSLTTHQAWNEHFKMHILVPHQPFLIQRAFRVYIHHKTMCIHNSPIESNPNETQLHEGEHVHLVRATLNGDNTSTTPYKRNKSPFINNFPTKNDKGHPPPPPT